MIQQLIIGSVVIAITIVVEALFIVLAVRTLRRLGDWFEESQTTIRMVAGLVAVTVWLMLSHTIGVWLWALTFLGLDVFHDLENALYFSAVAFTTLGFGDVIVEQPWRLLSGMSAANGLLIFGVSAAFLVEFMRRILEQDRRD